MAVMAIHPGEHLAAEMKELRMSAAELARRLQVPQHGACEWLCSLPTMMRLNRLPAFFYLARVLQQHCQKPEWLLLQLYAFSIAVEFASLEIYLEAAELNAVAAASRRSRRPP